MDKFNVFPRPSSVTEQNGSFIFNETDTIYLICGKNDTSAEFEKIAPELWRGFTAGKSRLEFVKKDGVCGAAVISADKDAVPDKKTSAHEYELVCGCGGIYINYNETVGLIHAFSTVLQLIGPYSRRNKNFAVPCCEIKDSPLLKLRGVHICVFPETSLRFVKKVVRLCGLLKVSHVILEFWGTYRYKFMKELSWESAFTAEDIKPIISDGRGMGIEFIPMFNHMGHASQSRFKAGKNVLLDNAPEYEEFFEPGGWTWNVKNPEVLELQAEVRRELAELCGEGRYFHVGCDEVYFADGNDDGLDPQQNKEFVDYLNMLSREVKALGRQPIMWGDMFLDSTVFKYPPYCNNVSHRCHDFENNLKRLDTDMIIDDWQYNSDKSMDDTVKFFAERRSADKLILSPWEGMGAVSAEANIGGRCELAAEYGMLGVIATTWDTLRANNRNLVYAACRMWSQDLKYTDMRTWEAYKCIAMAYIRKLLPSGGDFEASGWCEHEI